MATARWVWALSLILASQLAAIEGRAWAVKVERRGRETKDLEAAADSVALSLGLVSRGRVEPFADIFLFELQAQEGGDRTHPWYTADPRTHRLERSLGRHRDVVWAGRQDPLRRVKRGWIGRDEEEEAEFEDPCFAQQWHLVSWRGKGPNQV